MTHSGVKPDAVKAPLWYAGTGTARDKLGKLHEEFSRVLESGRIYVRLQGAEHFITASETDTLLTRADCSCSGAACYRWIDRGDGVFYGYREQNAVPV